MQEWRRQNLFKDIADCKMQFTENLALFWTRYIFYRLKLENSRWERRFSRMFCVFICFIFQSFVVTIVVVVIILILYVFDSFVIGYLVLVCLNVCFHRDSYNGPGGYFLFSNRGPYVITFKLNSFLCFLFILFCFQLHHFIHIGRSLW